MTAQILKFPVRIPVALTTESIKKAIGSTQLIELNITPHEQDSEGNRDPVLNTA